MKLKRAIEIVNEQDECSNIFYKENPVKILNINNNIGTAYVKTLQGDSKFEVDLKQLSEIEK